MAKAPTTHEMTPHDDEEALLDFNHRSVRVRCQDTHTHTTMTDKRED